MKISGTTIQITSRQLSAYLRALGLIVFVVAGQFTFSRSTANAQTPALKTVPSKDVIAFLNQSIQWYQHTQTERQLVTTPEDIDFLTSDHQAADQIIRLSFDFATADADVRAKQKAPTASPDESALASQTNYQSLLTMASKADQQLKDTQDEMEGLKRKLDTAKGADRAKIQSTISELQSEVDLDATRRDVLRNMVDFVGNLDSSGGVAGGLRSTVEELRRAVPAAAVPPPAQSGAGAQKTQASPQADANALALANLPIRKAEPS